MTEQGTVKGEYDQSMTIHAPADEIFDFIADVRNLPKYLPSTKKAQAQQTDRVRIQGEVKGHTYNADGYLRANRDQYRLEWGADERDYSGYLQIMPQDSESSQVQVHLSFHHLPVNSDQGGPSDDEISEAMQKALQSIENYVTGKGGKEEPSTAT